MLKEYFLHNIIFLIKFCALKGGMLVKMKTGFKDLDKIVKIERGDLIIIASRPAMGKTTLAQIILSNIAIKYKKKSAFFSLDESREKIIRLFYGVNVLKDTNIFIDATAPQTLEHILKKSCELKEKENIELIVIDYLQLIQCDKSKSLSRENEIEDILKELKLLAKKLNVSIIVTSQLSRKPEERNNKRPVITDFTNTTSSILNYADKILFLYRDSYYNKENKSNMTEIIVEKNKNGKIGTTKLEWMQEYGMFGKYDKI